MNYQTSQLRRIARSWMLLVQLSRRISQPGQAYKMGILEKIVNGLKFILRLILWIWRVYFVWTLGSVIQVIQLISTLKKLFVSYLSITWIMNHWIQGNNRILTITRITWITSFLFISCLNQFCLYFPKSSNNGIARKHGWKKSKTYIRNQTCKRLVW